MVLTVAVMVLLVAGVIAWLSRPQDARRRAAAGDGGDTSMVADAGSFDGGCDSGADGGCGDGGGGGAD